ncbi:CheR family methyltransferase [Oceanicoccus sagamiensis]|uniref:Chemotaxis protein methyltransferase n=1 Tax=Oceanicoccus sagamiensis TaxID=716816 RepID=A0A1X9NL41_9GAMM|nr:protein-glutamate O-methyltransferase CheR [Oceanicoccus sagamiensis]ARN74663.1 hypothetical protein BST96_11330 [Oceanicoccus sagamiensis]
MLAIHQESLSSSDFERIAAYVFCRAGLRLTDNKRSMVEGRLRHRLKALKLATFEAYTDYVFGPQGQLESVYLVESLTTHKTHFFREQQHFDYLRQHYLPLWVDRPNNASRTLKVWSAGCSTGEEAYSLAMLLLEWNQYHQKIKFEVYATDISRAVVVKAVNGLYREAEVSDVPLALRQKYFLRSVANTNVVKMGPELQSCVSFGTLNLLNDHYTLPGRFDIIFCRNVLIYFDRPTEEKVINQLCRKLKPQGHLFLGHSESITGLNVPLDTLGATTYKLKG